MAVATAVIILSLRAVRSFKL